MKTGLLFAFASLALVVTATADDQLLNVQTLLKGQGFYYGDIDGQSTSETTSAIRRYQIRNGLEVTGSLTPETLASLGLKSSKSKAIAEVPQPKSPVNIRRDESVEESDRNFLRREETKSQPSDFFAGTPAPAPAPAPVRKTMPAPYAPPTYETPSREESSVPPPAPLDAPSADFPVLFAGTPYASAPPSVQQQTLRRAQSILADRGFYRDIVDGLPGPATEEALLTFQRSARLVLSGRLDNPTLHAMHLMPSGGDPEGGVQFGFEFRMPRHVFRGVWVNPW
jgi:peptidoglycan hydrolase-like protein with peptidoglycan-binding domain